MQCCRNHIGVFGGDIGHEFEGCELRNTVGAEPGEDCVGHAGCQSDDLGRSVWRREQLQEMLGSEESTADVESLRSRSISSRQEVMRVLTNRFVPPRLLINVLDRLFCFENRCVVHEHIGMSVLLLHFVEERTD